MTQSIYNSLLEKYPYITGNLFVKEIENQVIVAGELQAPGVSQEINDFINNLILDKYRKFPTTNNLKIKPSFFVAEDDEIKITTHEDKENLSKVEIIYQGMLNLNFISKNEKFKIPNTTNFEKIDNAVIEMQFISPLVLDSNLSIIDGNLRYDLAKSNGMSEVPVVIINDNGIKADLLRLTLNRSSEFQRWNYEAIDPFVDSIPVVQPILEPLGFFGLHVLPESYFANTMMEYLIDPFNTQQGMYSQDTTIADWAKFRAEEIPANMEKRLVQKEVKASKKLKQSQAKDKFFSLFDLKPKKEDYLETYNINKDVEEHTEHMKEVAEGITNKYDEKRKAELEAKGKEWQNSRRTNKQVAADNRKEFVSYVESLEIDEKVKEEILNNIEEFASKKSIDEYLMNTTQEEETNE